MSEDVKPEIQKVWETLGVLRDRIRKLEREMGELRDKADGSRNRSDIRELQMRVKHIRGVFGV